MINVHVGLPPDAYDARYLLAWLPDDGAVRAVLGRPPMPTDDLAPVRAIIESAPQARARRQP